MSFRPRFNGLPLPCAAREKAGAAADNDSRAGFAGESGMTPPQKKRRGCPGTGRLFGMTHLVRKERHNQLMSSSVKLLNGIFMA